MSNEAPQQMAISLGDTIVRLSHEQTALQANNQLLQQQVAAQQQGMVHLSAENERLKAEIEKLKGKSPKLEIAINDGDKPAVSSKKTRAQ